MTQTMSIPTVAEQAEPINNYQHAILAELAFGGKMIVFHSAGHVLTNGRHYISLFQHGESTPICLSMADFADLGVRELLLLADRRGPDFFYTISDRGRRAFDANLATIIAGQQA